MRDSAVQVQGTAVRPLQFVSALTVCLAAPAWFVLHTIWLGIALAALGLALAWCAAHKSGPHELQTPNGERPPSLLRDLSLIVVGLAIVRLIPLAAQLDTWSMVKFTLALGGAVLVTYLFS